MLCQAKTSILPSWDAVGKYFSFLEFIHSPLIFIALLYSLALLPKALPCVGLFSWRKVVW